MYFSELFLESDSNEAFYNGDASYKYIRPFREGYKDHLNDTMIAPGTAPYLYAAQGNRSLDREYFLKVEEYYKDLINKSRETPQYLYYLIEAQCRAGKKKEALENINKALQHPNPFPSVQELKRLKKTIYK